MKSYRRNPLLKIWTEAQLQNLSFLRLLVENFSAIFRSREHVRTYTRIHTHTTNLKTIHYTASDHTVLNFLFILFIITNVLFSYIEYSSRLSALRVCMPETDYRRCVDLNIHFHILKSTFILSLTLNILPINIAY